MTATTRNTQQTISNADLARAIYDSFNRGDIEGVIRASSPAVTVEFVAWEQKAAGHEGLRAFLTTWKTMAPDGAVEVLSQFSGDEGVVNECVFRGTNTGKLVSPEGEIDPTGRDFAVRFCELFRITDGKLVSLTNYADTATLLVQLGLMPQPANATA
jgi:ketosteroid isomerase-like protein